MNASQTRPKPRERDCIARSADFALLFSLEIGHFHWFSGGRPSFWPSRRWGPTGNAGACCTRPRWTPTSTRDRSPRPHDAGTCTPSSSGAPPKKRFTAQLVATASASSQLPHPLHTRGTAARPSDAPISTIQNRPKHDLSTADFHESAQIAPRAAGANGADVRHLPCAVACELAARTSGKRAIWGRGIEERLGGLARGALEGTVGPWEVWWGRRELGVRHTRAGSDAGKAQNEHEGARLSKVSFRSPARSGHETHRPYAFQASNDIQ